MADKIIVKGEKREQSGKGYARRLRQQGKVPVSIYGGGTETVSASVELKDLAAVLRSETGPNTLFSLDITGIGPTDVLFQDRQIDPLKGRLLHADLRRFAKGEKIEVAVPIHLVGEPVGVKQDGGVLDQHFREIKVVCEPANIPEFFEVNIENLELNQSVHVSDLQIEEGLEVHEEQEAVVATVVTIKEEELEPATADQGEPEIVGDDKGETEEGGE